MSANLDLAYPHSLAAPLTWERQNVPSAQPRPSDPLHTLYMRHVIEHTILLKEPASSLIFLFILIAHAVIDPDSHSPDCTDKICVAPGVHGGQGTKMNASKESELS